LELLTHHGKKKLGDNQMEYLETTRFGELLKPIQTLKDLNLFGWNRASGHHSSSSSSS
jgi:hypothetical protein